MCSYLYKGESVSGGYDAVGWLYDGGEGGAGYLLFGDLKSCGYPNAIDGDVDRRNERCNSPLYPVPERSVRDNDGDSIDNDLQ